MSLELTPTQQHIYFEGRFFGKVVNNIGGYQVYRCDLDVPRFRSARDRLLRNNDAYRLRFAEKEGGCTPFMIHAPPAPLPVVECATEASALAWVEARMAVLFDDLSECVFEDALLQLDSGGYWYYAKAHHLIMDGWGFALQMKQLLGTYLDACPVGPDATAPEPMPSLVDYMRRQSGYRDSQPYANSRDYWLSRHQDNSPPLFPQRAGVRVDGSGRVSAPLSPTLVASLRTLASAAKVDLLAVLYAALYVYFSRTCKRRDIVIGSPGHNRRTARDKTIIGSLVNINMHRFSTTPDSTLGALMRECAATLRQDHRHGKFPLGDLIRALRATQGVRESIAYDIAVNYQKLDFRVVLDGIPVETHFVSHHQERVPLTFVLCEYGEQCMRLHLDHARAYFDGDTARGVLRRIVFLLEQIAADGDRPIDQYPLLTPEERDAQRINGQGRHLPLRHDACLHEFFEEQAKRTPGRVAVTCHMASLTYWELDLRANMLAQRLIALGAKPGDMVGICHGRSPDLVIALMAVLKSGAAYVPIDPNYPAPRIRHIIEDARPAIVIADADGAAALDDFAGIALRTDVDASKQAVHDVHDAAERVRATTGLSATDIAYVIYTSGSTGRPKGVLIEHRNAAAFVQWALAHYRDDELSVVLAATSICFDLSVFELFVTLAAGGRLVLVDNVLALHQMELEDLTLINTVPSAIRGLLDANALPRGLRCINLAGEFLHQDIVDGLYGQFPSARVYDLYGPSETTTYSTVCLRTRGGEPLIGRPIHNTSVFVLDDAGEPLPSGAIGELHIGGAGLSRGYLNQPALTDEKFVFNRYANQRLYSTGDLGRWTTNGHLQYRGRKDHQEKIRGFRVEPGEVEACLREHPAVLDCIVIGREQPDGGIRQLVAYVVADQRTRNSDAADMLATHLAERLPAYMVPSRFVLLPALPLTANGKVDRTALPEPADEGGKVSCHDLPRTHIEKRIADMWRAILQQDAVGIHDDFFSRGGDSLHLLTLSSAIEREFGLRIELGGLLASTTIHAQSNLVAQRSEHGPLPEPATESRNTRSDAFIDL